MRQILPVSSPAQVRGYARRIAREHPRALATTLVLHGAAALAGLVIPRLIGDLVESVEDGTSTQTIDRAALAIALFLLVQTVLTRYARYTSFTLGETVLARLREDFVASSLRLPVGVVERAGTGDLLTRASRDIEALGWSMRFAVPEFMIAAVTVALTVGACLLVGPWVAVALVLAVPILWVGTRWYLRHAKDGYLRENASYAQINTTLAESVAGARTTEALGLGPHRRRQIDTDIAGSFAAERYTLRLRTAFFPIMEMGYLVPTVATLLIGGLLHQQGLVSLGDLTAATLYVQFLIDPLDRLISWMDELQVGGASLARLLGIAAVPDDRVATGRVPDGHRLEASDVRFAYTEGREVLHGLDLDLRPGERLAMVGPSGAGKSTLGRLLAGIHRPDGGSVTVGGVGLTELPLDDLRGQVALVTQEHHVFVGSVRDNLELAVDGDADEHRLRTALEAVDAWPWVTELPSGLDTAVGSGGHHLSDAQSQQLALARLVLADPHTLVLDEATSLIDPRSARHLERSLGAVLAGRTVVAIAHRLYTAHDADRIAVVEDGRIAEIGSHDELVAHDEGSYAALWRSWNG